MTSSAWDHDNSQIVALAEEYNAQHDKAYGVSPNRVVSEYRSELAIYEGGYRDRQVYELIQNAADAATITDTNGRIELVFDGQRLYCANTGAPLSTDGIRALQFGNYSPKPDQPVELIGRFGVGFRSLLGLTDRVELYSRTGSVVFDRAAAAERIQRVVPEATQAPAMAYAFPVDVRDQRDPVLARLVEWADTIVAFDVNSEDATAIADQLAAFPAEFLLFAGRITRLTISTPDVLREIQSRPLDENVIELDDGAGVRRWFIAKRNVVLSDEARRDGGFAQQDTGTVPLAWATPLDGAVSGQVWCFFPTDHELSLSGVLNAPWKTTQDRTSLVKGPRNNELLRYAAKLVADSLQRIAALVDDEGYVVDLLPGLERQQGLGWIETKLREQVYRCCKESAAFADRNGARRRPAELRIVDRELPADILSMWLTGGSKDLDQFAHHRVMEARRHERLVELGARQTPRWLERGLSSRSSRSSIRAIKVMAAVERQDCLGSREQTSWRSQRVVLSRTGEFMGAIGVRIDSPSGSAFDGATVHDVVAADEECRQYLLELGAEIGVTDAEELVARAEELARSDDPTAWEALWADIDRLGFDAVANDLADALGDRLRIRCMDGAWRRPYAALWPGPIVEADGSSNPAVTFDSGRHSSHRRLLEDLFGVVDSPRIGSYSWQEPILSEYQQRMRRSFVDHYGRTGSNVALDQVQLQHGEFPGPLEPLRHLDEWARSRMTEHLLALGGTDPCTVLHRTRPNQFPALIRPSPLEVALDQYGRVKNGAATVPYKDVLPRRVLEHASEDLRASLPNPPDGMTDLQARTFARKITSEHLKYVLGAGLPSALVEDFFRLAMVTGVQLDQLPAWRYENWNAVRSEDAEVTAFPELWPADHEWLLPVTDQAVAEWLVTHCGAESLDAAVEVECVRIERGERMSLGELLPGLQSRLSAASADLSTSLCSELGVRFSNESAAHYREELVHRTPEMLYVRDGAPPRELAAALVRELELRLPEEDVALALEGGWESAELRTRLADACTADTVEEKIIVLVGIDAALTELERNGVPDPALLDPYEMGRALMALHGVGVLRSMKDVLPPGRPERWYGNPRAVDFVRRAGLPSEFAGLPATDRPPLEHVDGPVRLPPLHDYQRTIADRIQEVVADCVRAMVSLPTGAGKTRVAVQGAVEALRDRPGGWTVLWVAQSDELCEQATRAWRLVWSAEGSDRPLALTRLWDKNRYVPVDGPHVVVASIQKLSSELKRTGAIAVGADLVIVDEAHHSIASSYTGVLAALGLEHRRTEVPLLGLSATPFRGIDHDESNRLAGRYGRRRLDEGVFGSEDPLRALRDRDVLAHADHRIEKSGYSYSLDDYDLEHFRNFGVLPSRVEEEMGLDPSRNERLIEVVLELPSDWPVLVYCPSVASANRLAMMLAVQGADARSLSGETATDVRRLTIKQFGADVRIITNYRLLAEGFDAPGARAVVIARPVFSPNLYQQMIGRGLRGPKSGGERECTVVDVEDNLVRFDGEFAFKHFDYLWG